jgi:hypothetical protein
LCIAHYLLLFELEVQRIEIVDVPIIGESRRDHNEKNRVRWDYAPASARACVASIQVSVVIDGCSHYENTGGFARLPPTLEQGVKACRAAKLQSARRSSSLISRPVVSVIWAIEHTINLACHDKIVLVQSLDLLGAQ